MAKSKDAGKKSRAPDSAKAMTSVKEGAVTKSSQAPKAKSQEMAKKVAEKASKAGDKIKKIVKEPTPSSSEEEASDDAAETSDSSESSGSEAESKPVAKANGANKNGVKGAATANGNGKTKPADDSGAESDVESEAASDDGSGGSSDEASGSGSEGDSASEEEAVPAVQANAPKVPPAEPAKEAGADAKITAKNDSEDEDSEDDEESEDDKPKASGALEPKASTGSAKEAAFKKDTSDTGSDSGSEEGSEASDSQEDSSSEDEKKEEPIPQKKRKTETEEAPAAKKAKVAESGSNAPTKTLFVGNLSWNIDEEWLSREFEQFGTIENVRILTDRETGKPKGFGFVEFVDIESAEKAYEGMKDVEIDGRRANVDYNTKPRKQSDGPQRAKNFGDSLSPPSSTLFVGNVSFGANEDTLSEAFGEYGSIRGIRLPTSQETGEIKGFGYVEFSSVDEATAALKALNGQPIAGRPIRLDYSQPRSNDGGNRGGFGNRGRGGDRGRGRGRGGDRGGRGGFRGGRGGASTNRGGFSDFKGSKTTF